jgi:hypothetical protein
MNRICLSIVLALVANVASAEPRGWHLLWSDEFNGPTVDQTKWEIEDAALVKNNERQYYAPDDVYIEKGALVLRSRKRTMGSRWRTVLKEKYGGELWFRVLISTGTIPPTMLRLANTQLAQRQQPRAPASSRGPAWAGPAGAPTGSQHQVSGQKRQRQLANRLTKLVRIEEDMWRYGTGRLNDRDLRQLQSDAEWATTRAFEASRASGYSYRLNGETHGAPETSNFAILLASFCASRDIDMRTGFRRPDRRR